MERSLLAIHGGEPQITDPVRARFIWPRVDDRMRQAVLKQLDESLSIYDNSGIFSEFERAFCESVGREYGLLFNSGTSAISAMYEAIPSTKPPEVLCPVYTFHATVSPLMYIGGTPIFCDSDMEGNITLDDIRRRRTSQSVAVIATHMWGAPVKDIEAIARYCRDENLLLLEDCSHAHGAELRGRAVGSFGDMAAWSLQGKKTVTGGEGGIFVTDEASLYYRSLLQGHYNRRPKVEIPKDNPLRDYALTGMGMKLRAHPLAVAIAADQFQQLSQFIEFRCRYARIFQQALGGFAFLDLPAIDTEVTRSWYAYTILYNSAMIPSVSRERFVEALHCEGLSEVDIPGSTNLINSEPLFNRPDQILSRVYDSAMDMQSEYPNAEAFCSGLIKLPVWTFPDEEDIVQAYARGMAKVADYISEHQSL
ncbi:DegT/DnrJ/EryC1/StrS family aminotransferase [Mycobacteroides saopaulense]|uniref:DegT/DnrJ/EryC1/StrS family aminotransferase n=1 Tax=Mycobacteroides saopaulense TaxID=1578165 RepID=UPI0009F30435|nr:DegT/DnrJ/EryC1/StrS family aminotransferase [Mycobacteroides saopaulense]